MNQNENSILYLFTILCIAALLSAEDSTAWIGYLILVGGVILGMIVEIVLWARTRIEVRRHKKKRG